MTEEEMMNAAIEESKKEMITNNYSPTHNDYTTYEEDEAFVVDDNEQPEENFDIPQQEEPNYYYNTDNITIQNYGQNYDDLEINVEEETSRLRPYMVLTQEDIILQQTSLIKKTSELLGVSFSDARVLLKIMKWDSDQLFLEYTDNPETVCKKAGIDPENSQIVTGKKGKGECLICMEDSNNITTLSCGHGYCTDCWKQYLTFEVKEKKKQILCPGLGCGRVMDEFIVVQLLDDASLSNNFNQNLIESYVNDNSLVKWCPAPGCKYAISLQEFKEQHNESVKCSCSYRFCFRCLEEAHEPSFCKQYCEWKVKNAGGDEGLNEKFISTISKKCPNCKNSIEKNGGCNHMCCRTCSFHFCWLCMGKFGNGPLGSTAGYSNHKCNNYEQEDSQVLSDKESWERFRWYSERYNAHSRSQQLEEKLRDTCDTVRATLHDNFSLSVAGSHFYAEAISELILSRIIMRGSYIFGYFRPVQCPEIHKELFEHRQNELERYTENLSQLLGEGEPNPQKLVQNRMQLLNVTKMVTSSYKALLDVAVNAIVENGSQLPEKRTNIKRKEVKRKSVPEKKKKKKKRNSVSSEDEELQQAIKLSKEDEENQLRRAIELSLKEMNPPAANTGTTVPPPVLPPPPVNLTALPPPPIIRPIILPKSTKVDKVPPRNPPGTGTTGKPPVKKTITKKPTSTTNTRRDNSNKKPF